MPPALRRALAVCIVASAAVVLQACTDGGSATEGAATTAPADSPDAVATSAPPDSPDAVVVRITDGARAVLERCLEVADVESERNVGLSGRDAEEIGDGMLFRFETSAVRPFWMRDTRVPLLLMPLGADGRIAEVIPMQPCRPADGAAGRCPLYEPSAPYAQAVELPTDSLSAAEAAAVVPGATVEIGAPCDVRR